MIEKSNQAHCDKPLTAGTLVRTACNGVTNYNPGMPCAEFNNQVIYFCLPECKRDFDTDPDKSCLASRLGEFKPAQ